MLNQTSGLVLHFLLELAAMFSLVHWGFNSGQNMIQKILLGLGVPLAAAGLWGLFRVPNDPGPAPVAIPGYLRLILEILILGGAAVALYYSGEEPLSLVFGIAIVIDYFLMRDRVRRLLA